MKRLLVVSTLAVCVALLHPVPAQAEPESSYTYWGIGGGSNSYTGAARDIIESAKDAGPDHLALSLDLLGFYWPLTGSRNTLVGCILNGGGDRYEDEDYEFQLSLYLFGISSMHFFGREPGAGLFVRADLGFAFYSINSPEHDSEGSSNIGYGGLIGGGYGIPITEGTRILLNVNYALRYIEGDKINSLGISVGGLF